MIGVVTTSYPRWEGDFAGSFVFDYVQALRRTGARVEVVAPSSCGEPADPSWLSAQSVTTVQAGPSPFTPFYGAGVPDNLSRNPFGALGLARFAHALRRTLRDRVWSAQVNHWPYPFGFVKAPCATQLGVFHSADLFALRYTPGRKQIALRLTRKLRALHFVTDAQRQQFLDWLPTDEKHRVAPRTLALSMPANPPQLSAARETIRETLGFSRPTVLVLSRLIALKGIDRLLRALTDWPAIDLVIAGTGPMQTQLQQLATPLGSRVRFVGPLRRNDVWQYLHAADVLAVPSKASRLGRTEGMPAVISEARAMGCPVVTTVSAAKQAFSADPGVVLIPSATPGAICAALQRAIKLERATHQPHLMHDIVQAHLRWL